MNKVEYEHLDAPDADYQVVVGDPVAPAWGHAGDTGSSSEQQQWQSTIDRLE